MKKGNNPILYSSKFRFNSRHSSAFTIVELLVVIVVIGILAAVTIVSYTGITNKAMLASLSSDLDGASRQLKLFQTINSAYPATISLNCATTPDTTTNKCLKLSPGNTITSLTGDYIVNNTTSPQTFSLTIKNTSSATIAVITDSSKPAVLTPAPLSPVADWLATYQGDHYGNFYDSVSHAYATVTRTTPKTVYDPNTNHIYDVPANYLAVTPRSDGKSGSEATIEESRTNYLLNSGFDIDSDSDGMPDNWAPMTYAGGTGNSVIDKSTSTYLSNSMKLNKTNDAGQLFNWSTNVNLNAGNTYTYSCWVKSNTTSAGIDIYDGTVWETTFVTSDKLNQWTRISETFPVTSTVSTQARVVIYGTSGTAYFDSCQFELGAFATSYIPTTTTSVTRNADVVTVPTSGWNSTAGTMAAAGEFPNSSAGILEWPTVNGTDDNLFRFYKGWGDAFMEWKISGTDYLSRRAIDTEMHVLVIPYINGSGIVGYLDGIAGSTQGGAKPIYTNLATTANIGRCSAGGIGYANASIHRATIYSSNLSVADVTTITNSVKDGP